MVSKVFFSALIGLLSVQIALADPDLCPDPSDANQHIFSEKVSEVAPDFGRIERQFVVPKPENPVSCITWGGYVTSSMIGIGFSDDAILVRVVSQIRRGFYADLDVYAKKVEV